MPIPSTRQELVDQLTVAFEKLEADIRSGEESLGADRFAGLSCAEEWSVKDVLAVRRWWNEQVARWIEAGLAGKRPVTPKRGYKWTETPRLNAEIVAASQDDSWRQVLGGLMRGYAKVLNVIDQLDDQQLLQTGVYAWADKWPIARWISINTSRQYSTARTMIRKAMRDLA